MRTRRQSRPIMITKRNYHPIYVSEYSRSFKCGSLPIGSAFRAMPALSQKPLLVSRCLFKAKCSFSALQGKDSNTTLACSTRNKTSGWSSSPNLLRRQTCPNSTLASSQSAAPPGAQLLSRRSFVDRCRADGKRRSVRRPCRLSSLVRATIEKIRISQERGIFVQEV